jgi:hypothetical protein
MIAFDARSITDVHSFGAILSDDEPNLPGFIFVGATKSCGLLQKMSVPASPSRTAETSPGMQGKSAGLVGTSWFSRF